MSKFLFVGLGGAIGAMLRYGISLIPVKTSFPILTLLTNVAGAVLIGMVVAMSMKYVNISSNAILLLKTGVCGGFTTFSTFSLESFNLFQGKSGFSAVCYIVLSVCLCIMGVWAGEQLIR